MTVNGLSGMCVHLTIHRLPVLDSQLCMKADIVTGGLPNKEYLLGVVLQQIDTVLEITAD